MLRAVGLTAGSGSGWQLRWKVLASMELAVIHLFVGSPTVRVGSPAISID